MCIAAAYQLGYRLALLCAGAGALYIAEFVSWHAAYFAMAALMVVGMTATLLAPVVDKAPEPEALGGATREVPKFSFAQAVIAPLRDLFRRKGLLLIGILALVALYRLPDFVAGVMANPLLHRPRLLEGRHRERLEALRRLGRHDRRFRWRHRGREDRAAHDAPPRRDPRRRHRTSCSPGLPWKGAKLPFLVAAISVDNFAGSFAGSALIAYMSGLTAPGFAATQYALLSSLYALPGKLVGGVSGFIVQAHGYATFFTMTAAVGIPVVLLCLFLWPYTTEAEAEDEKAETGVGLQPPAPAPAR